MTTANNAVVTAEMIEAGFNAFIGTREGAKASLPAIYLAMTQSSPPPDEPTQPKLEKVMRQAAFASTEHRYDLAPPDEMVADAIWALEEAVRKDAKVQRIGSGASPDEIQAAAEAVLAARAALQSIGPLMRENNDADR